VYDLLEVKHRVPGVTVEEDGLIAESGKEDPGLFSLLENKARVLKGRHYRESWFGRDVRIRSRVVLGPGCQEVRFRHRDHQTNRLVLRAEEAVEFYTRSHQDEARGFAPHRLKKWHEAQVQYWTDQARKVGTLPARDRLGRFRLLRSLPTSDGTREYHAVD